VFPKRDLLPAFKAGTVVAALQCEAPDLLSALTWVRGRVAAAIDPEMPVYYFSLARGLEKVVINDTGQIDSFEPATHLPAPQGDPMLHTLKQIADDTSDGVYLLADVSRFLAPPVDRAVLSSLLVLSERLKNSQKRVLLVGHRHDLPEELLRVVPVFDVPLPGPRTLQTGVAICLNKLGTTGNNIAIAEIADTASGLTLSEIQQQLRQYFQQHDAIDRDVLNTIARYKRTLLKAMKVEVYEPANHDFGGHDLLREWLARVRHRYSSEAREAGLPLPKGCLLAGVSGCGKTLIAKALSASWNLPLLVVSVPALKGGIVGESEQNLLRALRLIDTVRGIVLVDEIEKAVAEDSSSVGSSMLSILLTWMQEQSGNFLVATANDVSRIPSELLRAGRLDRCFFVGLPNARDRREILRIHATKNDRTKGVAREQLENWLEIVAEETDQFSGAELEAVVIDALEIAFGDGRPCAPVLDDFRTAIAERPPLARQNPERHQRILEFAKRAQPTARA